MKNPIRTTIAFDEETAEIFEKLKAQNTSQSEIIRKALKFYYLFRDFEKYDIEKLNIYVEMLAEGEHVILDLDHLVSFLRITESYGENEKFWEIHREIARSHAEQFKGMSVEQVLKRLEACNFFRLGKSGEDYILVFGSEDVKKFIRIFLEEILKGLNKDAEIKENLTKIRINVKERD